MEVKLLNKGYKKHETLYQDFLNDRIKDKEDYFSGNTIKIDETPDFPFYMGRGSEEKKKQDFLEAFRIVSENYLDIDQEVALNGTFWHSLLVTEKRDYILEKYPEVTESESKFRNVVLKKFDWENYIYKVIVGAQYIYDNVRDEVDRNRYFELIVENLDLYNYIIKYEIFRNDAFLINILDIVDELNLSKLMKAQIKGREDLGDDERYGRRVIFEFNKSYPVVMSPMLDKEELKKYFIKYLSYYYDLSDTFLGELVEDAVVDVNRVSHVAEAPTVSYQSNNNWVDSSVDSSAVQVQENVETAHTDLDELHIYLEKHGLKYIDHRHKGGSIWVLGDRKIEPYLEPLKDDGINFRFKATGGKASKYSPAWFWYGGE